MCCGIDAGDEVDVYGTKNKTGCEGEGIKVGGGGEAKIIRLGGVKSAADAKSAKTAYQADQVRSKTREMKVRVEGGGPRRETWLFFFHVKFFM